MYWFPYVDKQIRIMLEAAYTATAAVPVVPKSRKIAKHKERVRAKRSRDDAGDVAEDVDGKHMHTFLHGGVIKSARVVWAKELTYLHVNVDECGDSWAKVFKTNQDSEDRATIAEHPGVPSSKFSIDVSVDDHTVVDTDVTTEELDSLRVFAQEWVADQIASNVVMDVDDSDDSDGAHGGGGAGGGGEGADVLERECGRVS